MSSCRICNTYISRKENGNTITYTRNIAQKPGFCRFEAELENTPPANMIDQEELEQKIVDSNDRLHDL